MSESVPHRRTKYLKAPLIAGALVAAAGAVFLGVWLARLDAFFTAVGYMALMGVGPGAFLSFLSVLVGGLAPVLRSSAEPAVMPPSPVQWSLLVPGIALWLGGWGLIAAGVRRDQSPLPAPSPAVGKRLHPTLANYRDFHGATFLAYAGGIFLAEATFIVFHLALTQVLQMPAVAAAGLAGLVAALVAFLGGFFGAARSQRLSVPEATLALLWVGMILPIFLSAMHSVPELHAQWGFRLREILYLAGLLGQAPAASYFLAYAFLVLCLVLGMTSGFIVTATGRVDLRASYELFIARRHVSVFRPLLLGGLFLMLLGLVLPPLLLYFVVRAAESAVERTRIKRLALYDPVAGTEELHRTKLREMTPTGMMTALSVGGVSVGVFALILVLSVMSGFELDLQQKILGTNAHGSISKYSGDMSEYEQVLADVRKQPGVVGATPVITSQVIVRAEGNYSGVMINGIDPSTVGDVTDLAKTTTPSGALELLEHPERIGVRLHQNGDSGAVLDELPAAEPKPASPAQRKPENPLADDEFIVMPDAAEKGAKAQPLPGILLGRELAASLRVGVGDRVDVMAMGDEIGPQGPVPRTRAFQVAGLVYSGMYEYDSKFVYIHLKEAQSLFSVRGAQAIELKVSDIDDSRRIVDAVVDALGGYPYRGRDWSELNRNLFSALRLEKLVMGVILSIIIVVAAGLIVATVIMLVLEKRKEISVLKALGVPDGNIVKIFLAEGLQIGVTGSLLGLLAGLTWCLVLDKVGFQLDPEVYYIPKLPVKVEAVQTALAAIIPILVTYLGSIYPALKAASVEPVEGLKAE